ncbi:MAG TPA: HEAT repeat domain-containing protein [Archangium sp.]|uniref:HEAT repeat domain-containing protein n=1 Tax=Archangium sp. TaxID=1872627 RepID=UPI002E34DC1F|nr:HEAT repeat domain-containing protein [Archangium sp.]HEX5748106.1 HEAT repeat domain-containing protein [Archangium sp.]
MDTVQLQDELVDACKWGELDRARELISRFGAEPEARTLLEEMLQGDDALARQAAVFGLGELGGTASVKRLEQQLALEETRGDYDGKSVVDEIIRTLGRIEDPEARAVLVRKLERLAAETAPEVSDVNVVTQALWRRRHPALLPTVRRCLAQLDLKNHGSLPGLRVLLEKTPDELRAWVGSPLVSVEDKTRVITVLDAALPAVVASTLPSFISTASGLLEDAAGQDGEAAYYCDRLFVLLPRYKEQVLPSLPDETRAELRTLARSLVPAVSPNCAFGAVALLELVGRPEDAAVIEANRPEDSVGAKAFDAIARALRNRQEQS